MPVLTTLEVRDFIGTLISSDNDLIMSNAINRNSEKSIGVFTAPESRMGKVETYGGDEFAPVFMFPVNILVRWTEDSSVCENKAREVFSALKSTGTNFFIRARDPDAPRIAFIQMLDAHPVWLGRAQDNICEFSIRINIFYY